MIDKIGKVFGSVANKIVTTTQEAMDAKPKKKEEKAPEPKAAEAPKPTLQEQIKQKVEAFSSFAKTKFEEAQAETKLLRRRFSNLLESNYEVGMIHLQKGDVGDAIFRFKFIKKFWPDHLKSYYQLAYCLAIKNKDEEAQKVLQELLAKDPNFEGAKELLKKVEDEMAQRVATKEKLSKENG